MIIADRLRSLREEKKMSQGDIEKKTGLLRCYISRVENGHTVPAIETLEKLARAMEVPMYELFYDGEGPLKPSILPRENNENDATWGCRGKDVRVLNQFRSLLGRMDAKNRKLLFSMAQKMALKGKLPK